MHTPRPWHPTDYGHKFIILTHTDGGATRGVCYVDGAATAVAEHEANVKLIAAAPDLLAALEDIAASGDIEYVRSVARAAIINAKLAGQKA